MLITKAIDELAPQSYNLFSCGIPDLDTYLRRFAKNNHKKGIGKTFLLLQEEKAIGFYTISMASVEFQTLPTKIQSGIPKYPIPVARIGRLAIDTAFKGNGFGKFLLLDALGRIAEASKVIAAYCVLVDAKDEIAANFYRKLGFESSKDNPLCLFLPLSVIENFKF